MTRAIRAYDERSVSEKETLRILDAGRRAGSERNLQRWDFVLVRERESLRALAEAGPFAAPLVRAAFGVALVTPDPKLWNNRPSLVLDLGRAAQNMMLAATGLAIASCPVSVTDHALVAQLLGLPDDRRCDFVLCFGYPADAHAWTAPLRLGGRRELADVVHLERWSQA